MTTMRTDLKQTAFKNLSGTDSVLHKKKVGAYSFKCKKTPRFLNKKKTKKKLYKYRK